MAAHVAGAAEARRVLSREPFEIVHHAADAAVAEQSLAILEAAVAEFHHRLPAGDAPIRVIIARTPAEFHRYARNVGSTGISGLARPSEGLIVVKAPRLRRARSDYRGTLRHELVHVLLWRNVNTAYLPKWLNEGLSMSLANEHYWNSILTIARMYVQHRIIPYKDLNWRFTAPGDEMAFGDAYAQALSMTRFMRNRFGEETFWNIVLATRDMRFGQALEKHAGMSVLDLWEAYRASLWKIALIGTIGSGSIFFIPAILLVLAVIRKHFTNRQILRRWEEEDLGEELILSWDDVAEGPHDWERDGDEDDARW